MGTFPTMALFFTISLCSPVVEGRAYCGSSFVCLSICLLVADVGGGIFRTPSHEKKEKKEALPTYLPKRDKRLYQISQCVVNYCTTKVLLDLFHGGLFILQSFQISHFKSVHQISTMRLISLATVLLVIDEFNSIIFASEYQNTRRADITICPGSAEKWS